MLLLIIRTTQHMNNERCISLQIKKKHSVTQRTNVEGHYTDCKLQHLWMFLFYFPIYLLLFFIFRSLVSTGMSDWRGMRLTMAAHYCTLFAATNGGTICCHLIHKLSHYVTILAIFNHLHRFFEAIAQQRVTRDRISNTWDDLNKAGGI